MKRPNIVLIMTDDHSSRAMSCYGSNINTTPHLDRIANQGMKFDNCFCTNAICAPSRAVILTGKHSHKNGVKTLRDGYDNSQESFATLLQDSGYQTAMIGKWHLGEEEKNWPTGFDYWSIFPGQGDYFDPVMKEMGIDKIYKGYATDIVTDLSLDWVNNRDEDKPFCLLCYHKAPHRPWLPDDKHKDLYKDIDIPVPETFEDDYSNRSNAAKNAKMRIEDNMNSRDLKIQVPKDIREWGNVQPDEILEDTPLDKIMLSMPDSIEGHKFVDHDGITHEFRSLEELKHWKYQRYIKDYLRCVASVDDNVGRLLDYLDENNLSEDTIVIYTSDQGFFLGEHGWFDKRFMYEESIRMPLLIKYPAVVEAGSVNEDLVTNLDFAETILDLANVKVPSSMQGKSLKPLLTNETPDNWRDTVYYRYWMHLAHHGVPAHYGIRTKDYKLIYYYGEALGTTGSVETPTEPEWELFDLNVDPYEMNNVYKDPMYIDIVKELVDQLLRHKNEAEDYE